METVPALPDDVATLQTLVRELLGTVAELRRTVTTQQQRIDELTRRLYGRKSERVTATPVVELTPPVTPPPPAPDAAASRAGHGRRPLPDHLPRERHEHDLSEAEKACPGCGGVRVRIGAEMSEQLDYRPASLFVVEHVRPTYACPCCSRAADPVDGGPSTITTAALPSQPIAKGLPGPGLLAHVIVSKFADHLPLYRLERIFERQGVSLARATLCDWLARAADLLSPLYGLLCEQVRRSAVLHTDDTPVPVQDATRDRTRQGRIWVYLGDENYPYTVFDYTPSRRRDGPAEFLKGYTGYLQADAFGGYDGIYAGGQVHEVGCWAHARRKFYEARTSDPERAHEALARIRLLYDVEDRAKKLTVPERQALRQAESVPILTALCQWLREQQLLVLPKSPLAGAIGYALNQWPALLRYTQAGTLAIDNNAAERALRGIAIGRKNWMFFGSDGGGTTAATLLSVLASCQRHEIDPFVYLRDVLSQIRGRPPEQLREWWPDVWKQSQANAAKAVQ
jgi:transposase